MATDREVKWAAKFSGIYLQQVPGAYFFVGAKMEDPKKVFPHHHEKFDFHEPAMEMIAKTFAGIVLDYQK